MDLLTNKKILIVDDDEDTREFIRLVLEDAGANVITAESVQAALKNYRKSPPHGVVTDIRLGSSDGYELITAIRKNDAEYRGFTAVVAVTGFASPEDRQRALAAGFDAYVTKPFEGADLVRTLGEFLRQPSDLAA